MILEAQSIPDIGWANTVPRCMPAYVMEVKRVLSMGGAQEPHIECIAGKVNPSPIPSKIRTTINAVKLVRAANGIRSVNAAVHHTPPPKRILPPNLLARYPPGNWVMMYP